ncbi:MAG TPA: hypothetical protein PK079_00165 [Leptospiraceae bacterium]|nr:hypothetical protein [Leptospiraceae bacterium]HMW05163.1 hypothetical protein [Leptospiraceae bacterium]HMX32576.1 hypothetical protein [Leptospiraceae bacterium]HMY32502.1 hypothetical protein [Leptospiraceae bacterium]HMZ67408.1 hypothetical protein [Leptospiraceae bacterium]
MKYNLILKILSIFISFFVVNCDLPEQTTESGDNVNLGYAIALKSSECGNLPNYPLYIAGGNAKPTQKDVQACSLAIIQQKCPFTNYPYYCLKIFKNIKIKIDNPLSKNDKNKNEMNLDR